MIVSLQNRCGSHLTEEKLQRSNCKEASMQRGSHSMENKGWLASAGRKLLKTLIRKSTDFGLMKEKTGSLASPARENHRESP
jgi:hypothetical protein